MTESTQRASARRRESPGKGAGYGQGKSPGGRRILLFAIGALVLAVAAWYFLGASPTPQQGARDSRGDSSGVPAGSPSSASSSPVSVADPRADFLATVLDDTAAVWTRILKSTDTPYAPPVLVMFSGAAPSACGNSGVAMGTFYCPGDGKLYIDLDFLQELRQRFPEQGDYAAAYVIAHEIGHHVQDLTGTTELAQQLLEPPMDEATTETPPPDAMEITPPDAVEIAPVDAAEVALMVELQADCYAGLWMKNARSARPLVEQSDPEKGLAVATGLGNELLRQKATGYVMPDPFNHGTAEQRLRWFRVGLTSGSMERCETFATLEL